MQQATKHSWGKLTGKVNTLGLGPRMYIARGFGEAASIASAPVAMVIVDKGFHKPYEDLKNRFAEKVILPNLQKWDDNLSKFKSFDPPYEREERHALSEPEQARMIADLLVDNLGVRFCGSLIGQGLTQGWFIKEFNAHVPARFNMASLAIDRTVQIGSAVLFNTALSKQAVGVQENMISMLQKIGFSEESAEDKANFAMNFQVPNGIAYLVSSEFLRHVAKRGK